MPDLDFQVEDAEVVRYAASPLLAFKLHVTNQNPLTEIRNVMLNCQVRIEATRRRYTPEEQKALYDLFGEPAQWSRSLRGMLWTLTTAMVPPFSDTIVIDLPVPCTFDLNVAATKYWYALEGGHVPLTLLFSGTMFYDAEDGNLQVTQIPWDKEATYQLPVSVWQEMMEHYYPNSAWLNLRRDVFDRLYRYKMQGGIPTWEQTFDQLLRHVEERVQA